MSGEAKTKEELLAEISKLQGEIKSLETKASSEEESRAYYEELYRNNPNGIAILDRDEYILGVNEAFEKMFLYTEKEVLGKHINSLIVPKNLEEAALKHMASLKTERTFLGETLRKRKDGILLDVEVISYPYVKKNKIEIVFAVYKDISERKAAEEKLRTLEMAVHQSMDGVVMLDTSNKIRYANEAWGEMHGYNKDEIIGLDLNKIYTKEQLQSKEQETLEANLKKYGFYQAELERVKKDGTVFLAQVSCAVIKDSDGKDIGRIAIERDITEAKETEKKMRESEQLYRAVAESALAGISIADLDENVIYANQAFSEMLGYKPEEFIGKNLSEFTDPEEFEKMKIRTKTRTEVTNELYESKLVRKNGTTINILVQASPLMSAEGKLEGTLGIFSDITKIKHAEEEQRKFRMAIEQSHDGIIILDLKNKIQYANEAFANMHGLAKEEILNQEIKDFHTKEQWDGKEIVTLLKAIEEKGFYEGEIPRKKQDGTIFPSTTSISNIIDENGEKIGEINVIRDITKQKAAEKEIKESQELLRDTIESTGDGILVVDNHNNITHYNSRFAEIWDIPKEILETKDNKKLTTYLLEQVVNADDFLLKVKELRYSAEESLDTILLKNDKVVERFSNPLLREGTVEGRVWSFRDVTERTRAEIALKKSEERYRSLQANLPVGVFRATPDGRILTANPVMATMMGYATPSELREKSIAYFPPVAQQRKDFLKKLSEEESVKNFEVEMWRQDETTFKGSLNAQSVRNESGSIEHIDGILLDISKEKEAEEELRRSEQRYRAVAESSLAGICTADPDENLIYVNTALAEMLGYSESELVRMNFSDLIHPEDMQQYQSRMKNRVKGKQEFYESRMIRKNGSEMHMIIQASPLTDNKGNYEGSLGIITDISEQKQAQEDLRESEEKFRSISSSAQDAIIIMDENDNISYWNEAAEKILGYSKKEIIGQKLHTLLAPDMYAEHYKKGLAKFRETGEGPAIGQTRELIAKRKDKEEIPVELSISAVLLKDQWHAIGMLKDITDRKRAESTIKKARDEAIEASKLKSQFLANMSHEIRTPMNGIIGMTELALNTELTDEQREYLKMVMSSADSLLKILNDILDFSKIEAGKLEMEMITFNLQESLADTMITLAVKAHEKGLELAYYIPNNIPDGLIGDPNRLRQVLVNLVGNAIKFTEQGEVLVNVVLVSRTEKEIVLLFSVSDTGAGIPEDKQERVFEAFAQADGSTTRQYGGTGLGLAISSQLVSMMGGKIWLESSTGYGTAFYFTTKFKLQRDIEKAGKHEPYFAGKRALIVDDNATNRRILVDILRNWGIDSIAVAGGKKALSELEKAKEENNKFDILLVDSNMPEMDGFGFIEEIRKAPELTTASIMMLTSSGQSDDIKRCQELGLSAYLLKPINQANLLRTIKTTLGIPLRRRDKSEPARPLTERSPKEKSLQILLVEDNLVNQKLAVKLLEKEGYKSKITSNGEEALEEFNENREKYNAILMDVQMPIMDGLEATKKIREIEKKEGGHIPIIAMTAHALKGDRERCLNAGMDGYISKPIKAGDFMSAIEEVVPKETIIVEEADAAKLKVGKEVKIAPKASEMDLFLKKFGNDPELLEEMINIFFQETGDQMKEVKKAVEEADAEAVRFHAHTVKGSIGLFEEGLAMDTAQELENMGRDEDLSKSKEMLKTLEKEITKLGDRLKEVMKELKDK